jgi:hypothetical protein
MPLRSSPGCALLLLLSGCAYDGPDADWCDGDNMRDIPPIVSLPFVVVVDSAGRAVCPPDDAVVRTIQGSRESTLAVRTGSRGERAPDGSVLVFIDPLGCNVFYSPIADALRICGESLTTTATVSSASCGDFRQTISWLDNYGTGQHGIDWVIPVEIDCPLP